MVDEWNELAGLLTDLIEKYASDLDIDKLSDIEKQHRRGGRKIERIRSFHCR